MSAEAAQRIRNLLTDRGLSERQASIASGLSPATVNALLRRLEKDGSQRVEQRTVDALAATLGVSPAWLLHGIGDAEAAPQPPPPDVDGATRFAALPNWTALLRASRAQRPHLPEWVWARVAQASPMLTAPPTAAMVSDLAEFVFRHESPPA
jgi:transcriptional regulator with XRE-family HTH domain